MQTRLWKESPDKIKKKLKKYREEHLKFNEPLFDIKLKRSSIQKREVIKHLLNPQNLIFVGVSESKHPKYDYVYDLFFKLSKNRTFKIVVSMKPKCLYVITVYKIRTKVQHEASKYFTK